MSQDESRADPIAELPGNAPGMTVRLREPLRRALPYLVFPVVLVAVALILGLAGVSGSSVSIHGGVDGSASPDLGRARSIRWDEFYVRTPLVVRQSVLGYPSESQVGVGSHDMGVQSDLPTSDWQTLLRPHHLAYRIFGVDTAFALEWWTLFLLLPAVGAYSLLLVCRLRVWAAALLGLAVALSPAVLWWTVPASGTSVGYGALAAAAIVTGLRARSWWAALALGAAAGWLGACFAAVLYPPWLIPLGLVLGTLVASIVVSEYPWQRPPRASLVRLAAVGAVALAVAGPLLIAFVVEHRTALAAMANSVYPGQRRRSGGAGKLNILLSSPFDLVQARNSAATVSVNGLNQSEAAAGIFLLGAVAAALVLARRVVFARSWRTWLPVVSTLACGAILVAWYLLPVPAAVGRFAGLDRVPSYRLLPPLGFASVLALGLLLAGATDWDHRTRRSAALAAALVFTVGTAWAAAEYVVDGTSPALWLLAVFALVFGSAIWLVFFRESIGLPVLVALLFVGAVAVNPVQRGLGPLTDTPAFRLGESLREDPRSGAVLAFANHPGGDVLYLSELTASGADIVSAVNLYPNEDGWRVLDPDEGDKQAWDRYATGLWGVAPTGSEPRVFLNTKDSVIVMVDPCSSAVTDLGVRTFVSATPLALACAKRVRTTRYRDGFLYTYRRLRPAEGSQGSG